MTVHVLKNKGLIQDEQSYLRGLPTKKNERWKYVDLSIFERQPFVMQSCDVVISAERLNSYRMQDVDAILLVFVDGRFEPAYSDLDKLPKEVIACSLQQARDDHDTLLAENAAQNINQQHYPFASFNATTLADGLFLSISAGFTLSSPLHVLSIASGHEGAMTHTQNVWVFGANSSATLVHEYMGLRDETYFTNVVTTIAAGKGSRIQVIKSQREGQLALHMENFFVRQAEESDVNITQLTTGGQLSRDDMVVSLDGTGSLFHTSGFYHTSRDGQLIDHHVDVKHIAKRTSSEMIYKGIADKKSRAVFNGSLYVEKDAQKINAVQENHHLLLSAQAEVYSKPELEIYADDVKCRHGATTGQLDQDALFYMRARGIDHATAMNILLAGFANDVLTRITDTAIQQHVKKQVKFL